MESKKINQLATELAPDLSDLTIIGDPTTGISKKITLSQMASLFTGTVEEYANLAAFPLVGVADTIYIALDTNIIYRYDTSLSAYVILSPNIINSLVFSDANGFDGTITLVGSVATLSITTALTSGSVPFIGASGALTQDNSNLFFDDTNNRLGINTNAPTTSLDVFGSGIIGRINGTSTNNAYLGFSSAGTNKWSVGNVQSDHRFRIFSEANSAELISVLQTGEFGIGIANPTTKFHIDGAASALIANLDANVSVAKSLSFRSDNSNRINLEVSGTESGSNAGADFFLRTYTDLGALIETPFSIVRSTGVTTIKSLTLTNVLSVANGGTGSATQNFVDLTTTQTVAGAKTFSAITSISNATASTSTTTGALKVTGGLGIGGALFGTSANFAGNVALTGSNAQIAQTVSNSISADNAAVFYNTHPTNSYGVYIAAGTGTNHTLVCLNAARTADLFKVQGDGKIGIGTSSPSYLLDVNGMARILRNGGDEALRISNDNGYIGFFNTANSTRSGYLQGNTTSIQLSSSLAIPIQFLTSDAEKMRISADGNVFIGCTGFPNSSVNGIGLNASGSLAISRSGDLVAFFNRNTNDGTIIDLRQDNNIEGTISVSGTTVSYNSFLGSHWSQLQDGSRIEILKGTILEAIDEMCIWEDEINDRLPKSKISDTIESKNVYGIFLDWDNDWQNSNDFYVSAVGLGYIRINANETIQIGDLLQSNGDGTAKVQSDDIMRSSTIAKVVLTNKIETYEDGSYLIAATLHCG